MNPFSLLKRWADRDHRVTSPEAQEAYEQGRQLGRAVSVDIDLFADELLIYRRRNFLEVLSGRLEGIKSVEGITYDAQARIELQVMLENWNEKRTEQQNEIWSALASKWGDEPLRWSEAEAQVLIKSAVDSHAVQLATDGIKRTAEAIELNDSLS